MGEDGGHTGAQGTTERFTMNIHDPFKPIPWQDFKTVARPSDRGMTVRVFGWLCGLVMLGAALWAINS